MFGVFFFVLTLQSYSSEFPTFAFSSITCTTPLLAFVGFNTFLHFTLLLHFKLNPIENQGNNRDDYYLEGKADVIQTTTKKQKLYKHSQICCSSSQNWHSHYYLSLCCTLTLMTPPSLSSYWWSNSVLHSPLSIFVWLHMPIMLWNPDPLTVLCLLLF